MLINNLKRLICSIQAFRKHDKRYESNGQMLARISLKSMAILVFLFMFDSLLEWLMSFIDMAIELIHLLIEAFEYSCGVMIEHAFHLSKQQSEIVLVNIVIVIALYSLYRLFRAMPRLFRQFKRNLLSVWLKLIRREASYWRALSLKRKINLITCYLINISGILYLMTL